MSEAKPKRKFWQIHLSTAVAMMFVAGTLLGVNFLQSDELYGYQKYYEVNDLVHVRRSGWPITTVLSIKFEGVPKIGVPKIAGIIQGGPTVPEDTRFDVLPRYLSIPVNVLTAITMLFASAALFEFLIRRREARKT
jgi:hypothetical protein